MKSIDGQLAHMLFSVDLKLVVSISQLPTHGRALLPAALASVPHLCLFEFDFEQLIGALSKGTEFVAGNPPPKKCRWLVAQSTTGAPYRGERADHTTDMDFW